MEKVDTLLFVCKIDKQSPSQEKHIKRCGELCHLVDIYNFKTTNTNCSISINFLSKSFL